MYSIHRRNVGASLIEINEGMSECVTNKLIQKIKLKITLVKCAMKIKVEENNESCYATRSPSQNSTLDHVHCSFNDETSDETIRI